MIVTAWILFAFCGFFALILTLALFSPKTNNRIHFGKYMFFVTVTAISAGVIWGGLFQ